MSISPHEGWARGELAYTTKVLRYIPSPLPSMPSTDDRHGNADRSCFQSYSGTKHQRTEHQRTDCNGFGPPQPSANGSAKNEEVAAGFKMQKQSVPWTVGDFEPKSETKLSITVMGPMMPVSTLKLYLRDSIPSPGR